MKSSLMPILVLLLAVSGCDYLDRQEFKKERASRQYQTAMDDYRAGRLDAALKGLQSACRGDPSNMSARFQLACLLQDVAKDYFGAVCAYREYIMQRPDSDKDNLAKRRCDECEKELAKVLAGKYGLDATAEKIKELEKLGAELKFERSRSAKIDKDLAATMQRVAALVRENGHLKSLLQKDNSEMVESHAAEIKDVKALLDEEDATAANESAVEVKDAKKLLTEDASETASPVIAQAPDAKARRDAERAANKEKQQEAAAAKRIVRPDSYVVQNGDTLYKIAVRFYGRSSAWSLIRNANKTIISSDGRIRTGQKLVLPAE